MPGCFSGALRGEEAGVWGQSPISVNLEHLTNQSRARQQAPETRSLTVAALIGERLC
jgi:hypothetical protein